MRFIVLFFAVSAAAFSAVIVGSSAYPTQTIVGSPSNGVSGPLVYSGIWDAPTPAWRGAVVLMDRGVQSFWIKTKAVQDAGGVGVIVANNVAGVPANTAQLDGNTSTIPAVTVGFDDGKLLRAKVGTTVGIGIGTTTPPVVTPPPAPPFPLDPKGHRGEVVGSDGNIFVWVKPSVVTPVVSGVVAEEVATGGPVNLIATADGTQPFTYQWLRNGGPIAGATLGTYSIISAAALDAGSYSCEVRNDAGVKVSGAIQLIVR